MRATRALLTTLAVAAAGCGSGGGRSPETVLSTARSAADRAASVHVTGTVTENGVRLGIDLRLARGAGASGSIVERGLTLRVIRIDDTVYVAGPARLYSQLGATPAAARLLAGRWLKAAVSRPGLAPVATVTDQQRLLATVLGVSATKLAGPRTVVLSDPPGRLIVRARYPFEIAAPSAHVRFSGWNRPVTLTVPQRSIDTSRLG
jgi:hypothetical protein